jgi:hypothetical protein
MLIWWIRIKLIICLFLIVGDEAALNPMVNSACPSTAVPRNNNNNNNNGRGHQLAGRALVSGAVIRDLEAADPVAPLRAQEQDLLGALEPVLQTSVHHRRRRRIMAQLSSQLWRSMCR